MRNPSPEKFQRNQIYDELSAYQLSYVTAVKSRSHQPIKKDATTNDASQTYWVFQMRSRIALGFVE